MRESGAIEQDADIVLFIAREGKEEGTSYYTDPVTGMSTQKKAIKCKLIIAKNRNGPTGEQTVWFVQDLTAFEPYTGQDTDEAIGGSANDTI